MVSQNKTMSEAKDWLRVSQPTLYRLINENKLKTYQIGRRRFTTVQELENCVRSLQLEGVCDVAK